jgi:hypothetical protein
MTEHEIACASSSSTRRPTSRSRCSAGDPRSCPHALDGDPIAFTLLVRCAPAGRRHSPRTLRAGPPDKRFVYVGSGTFAGDAASCWSRRAKVSLAGIDEDLVRAVDASPDACLEATIPGRAGDGGPSCASVRSCRGGAARPRRADAPCAGAGAGDLIGRDRSAPRERRTPCPSGTNISSATGRSSRSGSSARRRSSRTNRATSSPGSDRRGPAVVELGCGPQGCLDILAGLVGPSGRVVGVERGDESVGLARRLVADRALENVEVVHGDARATGSRAGLSTA